MTVSDDSVNLQDAEQVAALFREAAEANRQTAGRSGSVVDLPAEGKLLLTGDLHDNRENFEKVLTLAGLGRSSTNHVLFQEMIHGPHLVNGMDFSYRIMARAAQLKVAHRDQVHHVLSNHELAQVEGTGILKDSISVVEAFDEGLSFVFGEGTDAVAEAIAAYVRSLPLAVRTANGVLASHSLPGPRKMDVFDPAVLDRELTEADYAADGSAYLMVWGRNLTQEQADTLGEQWGVRLFVLGHQPADMGYEECGETMFIINTDHAHGVALPLDLAGEPPNQDDLAMHVLPLAGVL